MHFVKPLERVNLMRPIRQQHKLRQMLAVETMGRRLRDEYAEEDCLRRNVSDPQCLEMSSMLPSLPLGRSLAAVRIRAPK